MDGLRDSKRSLGSMSVGQHPESAAGATRLSYKKICGPESKIPVLCFIAHKGTFPDEFKKDKKSVTFNVFLIFPPLQ